MWPQPGQMRFRRLCRAGQGVLVLLLACYLGYGRPPGAVAEPYDIRVRLSSSQIWLLVNETFAQDRVPSFAVISVRVRNAQGQDMDGVPVRFELAPAWDTKASLTPERALTDAGVARAVFRAHITGVARVTVHVGEVSKSVRISVENYHGVSAR